MSVGLIALLDDIAALAKMAAASIDDVAAQASKASAKAAGVVIDDAAVTPRYMVGIKPERELPAIWRVTVGSLRNKLLFILPACLLLSQFAPWLITPLLMIGGAYLCYEGTEKVFEALMPHSAEANAAGAHADAAPDLPITPEQLEDERVASAIKTDFILSAEIMTISLGTLPGQPLMTQAIVLVLVALGITIGVYGVVGLIVKLDDIGLALARKARTAFGRGFGLMLLKAMPVLLKALSIIGTMAMIWVGGGILLHGLETFGVSAPAHLVQDAAMVVVAKAPFWPAIAEFIISALGSGLLGLIAGFLIMALLHVVLPLYRRIRPAAA